jgi:tRNA nucleotidyltransferase (CCA-adding enzyme)
MQSQITTITKQVLKEVTPSLVDRARMETLAKLWSLKFQFACEELGVAAVVRLEGSAAKDTWLKDDLDLDIFIQLPPTVPRQSLGEIALKIARKATTGAKQIERFAEHPYLEAFIDDTRVNIVPCYEATSGEWLSATDRTPYHTDYINKRMTREQKAMFGCSKNS